MGKLDDILEKSGLANPWDLPLDGLDVSDADIFEHQLHHEYFKRLRRRRSRALVTDRSNRRILVDHKVQ